MDISQIDARAREVCQRFQKAMESMIGGRFDGSSGEEREAWHRRKSRILQLRSHLSG